MLEVGVREEAAEAVDAAVDRADDVLGRACERKGSLALAHVRGQQGLQRTVGFELALVVDLDAELADEEDLEGVRKSGGRPGTSEEERTDLLAVVALAQDVADDLLVVPKPVHSRTIPDRAALLRSKVSSG